ncbi:MAG: hypothetical protein ABSE15_00335 [Candidatus Bathyarchaeia archaeon]|jgi:hypothetical protein
MTKRADNDKKQIAIQNRIEEVMNAEFEKLLVEAGDDILLKLVRQNKIDSISLEEIKKLLKVNKK